MIAWRLSKKPQYPLPAATLINAVGHKKIVLRFLFFCHKSRTVSATMLCNSIQSAKLIHQKRGASRQARATAKRWRWPPEGSWAAIKDLHPAHNFRPFRTFPLFFVFINPYTFNAGRYFHLPSSTGINHNLENHRSV